MAPLPPARFARLLRSLDAGELAAFVGDLWSSQGRVTTVDGRFVLVEDAGRGGPERVACVAPRRWVPRPRLGDVGDVDAVVAARDVPSLRSAAAARDARFVGPTELRTQLLYAIDRERAGRLFETHFGRSLPATTRRPAAARRWPDGVGVTTLGAALLLVLAAGLVLAGAGGGLPPDAAPERTATPDRDGAAERPDPAAAASTDSAAVRTDGYPPGLGPTAVTDTYALARAHGRTTAGRAYELRLYHRGSHDYLAPDRSWVSSRQTVLRTNETRFRFWMTGLATAPNGSVGVVTDDFADGSFNYRRTSTSSGPRFERGLIPTANRQGLFTALGEAYVRRFLTTTDTRVEVVEIAGRTRYKVVATGTPERIQRPVGDYRAVAFVDHDGLVRRLFVAYDLDGRAAASDVATGASTAVPAGDPGFESRIRFELLYMNVGETSFAEPLWYDDARNATTKTRYDLWPRDTDWWTRPVTPAAGG